jgi:hypothetical protein
MHHFQIGPFQLPWRLPDRGAAVTICLALGCACVMLTGHATETFHATFDAALDAELAAGAAKANARNVKQIPGKSGRAVQLGRPDQYLFYPAPDNLDLQKGSVVLWLKPIGFSPAETPAAGYDFFDLLRVSSDRDEIRLSLFRSGTDDNTNRCIQIQTAPVQADGIGGGPNRTRAYGWIRQHRKELLVPWPEGEFKHVAATWDFDVGQLEVYIDGRLSAAVQDANLKKKWDQAPSSFQVGTYNGVKFHDRKGSAELNIAIDEFKVFNRRLAPYEIAALAGITIADDSYDREKQYRLPLITIPETGQAPVIDGAMTAGEWDMAAGVTGFLNIGKVAGSGYLANDNALARVMYDGDSLYALFVTPIDNAPAPFAGNNDHYDPAQEMIEFWFAPNGTSGKLFQFIGAANNATYDSLDDRKEWNAKWQFSNSHKDGRWIAEIAVTFAELGVSPPQKGDEWRMNFCRYYSQEKRATCWSDTIARYNVVSRFGRARFGDAAVSLVTDSGRLLHGQIGWQCSLANPTDTGMHVELDVQSRRKPVYQVEGGENDGMTRAAVGNIFLEVHPVRLAAGETRSISINDGFQNRRTRFYSIMCARLPDRVRLFEQLIPLSPASGRLLSLKANALYDAKKVVAEIECGALRAQNPGPLTFKATLTRNGAAVATVQSPVSGDRQTIALEPNPWTAGEYSVEVVALRNQQPVATTTSLLHVEPYPEWWGNDIGKTDMVQPPWTPVQASDNRVSTWGRTYELGDSGLPSQIRSQDEPILADPVTLQVADATFTDAKLTVQTARDTSVVYSVTGSLGPYRVNGKVEVTFDGVAEYDYQLSVEDGTTDIAGLWLEIPLPRETAKYLVKRTKGQGLFHDATTVIKHDLKLPFNYSLWLGDVPRGLNWYSDTDEGWTASRNDAVELQVTADRVRLRVHVLRAGRATPVRLRFGLLATPFRPLKGNWRTLRMASNHDWWKRGNIHHYDTAKLALFGRSPLDKKPNGEFHVPAADRQWLDDKIAYARGRGAKFCLYSPGHGLAEKGNNHIYRTYHAEWDMLPLQTYNGAKRRFIQVCPKSRHPDFFMWNLDRMIKADKLDVVYFDQGVADPCRNGLHGCGYRDGAARHDTQTVRAQREFYRRVRQVFIDNGKEPFIIGHTSTQMIPANYTFLDAQLNGEQFTGGLVDNDYIRSLDVPMLLTQWRAPLMGIPAIFLPEIMWQALKRNRWSSKDLFEKHLVSDEAVAATRNLMALLLPNDIIFYGGLQNIPLAERIWGVWDTLGEAQYVSHRSATVSTRPGPKTVHAGLYLRPDGTALLAVGNLEETTADVAITIDPKTLDLSDMTVADKFEGKPCTLATQTVTLAVGGRDFRLVELKK